MVGTERRASKNEQEDSGSEGYHAVLHYRCRNLLHGPREAKRHSAEGDVGCFNWESLGLNRYCKRPRSESDVDESRGEREEDSIPMGTYKVESKGQKTDMK